MATIFGAAATVLLGCGSKQSTSKPDGGGRSASIAMDDFCATAIPAYCSHLARCRPRDAAEPEDDCRAHQGVDWCSKLVSTPVRAGVAAGRLQWNAERASACLDDLRAPACRARKVWFNCTQSHLVMPALPGGRPCVFFEDVLTGLYDCQRGHCKATSACEATCKPTKQAGEGCTVDDDCAGDLFCMNPAGDSDCTESSGCTCASRLTEGQACPTSSTQACAKGLDCRRGTCVGLEQEGMPCQVDEQCDGDLACLPTGDASSVKGGTCGPRRSEGGACEMIDDCAAGLTCRKGGKCGKFTTVEFDDCASISDVDGGGDCGLGLFCDVLFCVRRAVSSGERCLDAKVGCYGRDLYCALAEGSSFHCAGPARLGGRCWEAPCADPGTKCLGGVCTALAKIGESCSKGADCLSGNCYPNVCVDACP